MRSPIPMLLGTLKTKSANKENQRSLLLFTNDAISKLVICLLILSICLLISGDREFI
ncbi:hypothetical protein JOY44_13845 [Phormidium sp. CLA17]|uniref:hypothetical protein n=1 Tax=Leptolyngbya sp. Cla-17 TaxID=2803751 RepID=UPI001933990D|nr:hypothetical protein [Leptolyngbya sp. Cla-17]MBM0742678.1 hypothetical protein [Leptolyngbya sp. Cla-17]